MAPTAIQVGEVTLVCKGCWKERSFKIDPPLTNAREIKAWTDTMPGVERCACGATTADLKFTIAPLN